MSLDVKTLWFLIVEALCQHNAKEIISIIRDSNVEFYVVVDTER